MFAGLKNKIKEEIGGDVTRITLASATTPKTLGKGRHSRQGSATSLGSFSIDGKDDVGASAMDIKLADGRALTHNEFKKLETREDEWRKKMQKKEEEYALQLKKVEESWKKKIDDKERELLKLVEKKENENSVLLSEIKDLQSSVARLQEEEKNNAEYKSKLCKYQDDLDQLEGFQTQEMAKIKHLLLQKEQLLVENEKELAHQNQRVAEMGAELRRLAEMDRKLGDAEDRLEAMRHAAEQEKAALTSRLAAGQEEARHLKDRLAVLDSRLRTGGLGLGGELTPDERVQGLLGERALLERLLAEAHEHLAEVKTSWSGKITSLETQVGRLCRQASEESSERRVAETKSAELSEQLQSSERRCAALTEQLRDVEARCALGKLDLAQLQQERDDLAVEAQKADESFHSVNDNAIAIKAELEEKGKALSDVEERNSQLMDALKSEKEKNLGLAEELTALRTAGDGDAAALRQERREKDALMLRNAEVSQQVELARQELRRAQQDANDQHAKLTLVQNKSREHEQSLLREVEEKKSLAQLVDELQTKKAQEDQEQLRERNSDLESQILERNKTIKILQQRMSDIKKAMQKELKVPSRNIDPGGPHGASNGEGVIPPHGPALLTACDDGPDDVNFKYLKHVLFKFLTCREYEAQHLTRAVATLLRFTAEEERMLRETMDWKTSWFGSRPKIVAAPRAQPPS